MTQPFDTTDPTRLRNRAQAGDGAHDRAAHLLASVDGWAHADDALAERRVWRRIIERAETSRGTRRRAGAWRTAMVAGAVVLATGAVAGATVGRHFLRVQIDRLLDRSPAPEPSRPQRALRPRPAPAPIAEAPPPPLAPAPAEPALVRRASRPVARPATRTPPPSPAPAPLAASAEEGQLVMDAALALRRQASPARARALLERYVSRFPSGVLLEEVLALAMEAADTPDGARQAARRYLDRFPNGRFATVARDTLTATPDR